MAKMQEIVFQINAQLGNLEQATARAQRSMNSLARSARVSSTISSSAAKNLSDKLAQLNRNAAASAQYRELNAGIKDFTRQTAEAKLKAQELYRQYQESVRITQQMKENYDRLKAARRNDRNTVESATVKAARQELRAQENATANLGRQYRTAQSSAGQLNDQLRNQSSTLNNLRSAFSAAGVGVESLASHERNLQGVIAQTTAALERQQAVDRAQGNRDAAAQNFNNAYGSFQGAVSTAQGIFAPFKDAVQNAMTFEHSMNNVKALTQMDNLRSGNLAQVEADMAKLEGQARELGATTQFTMTQAADAMGKLGMAGWKTEQIYSTMPGMLDLATGAGTDLARTADIVSDNMTAMGVPAQNAGHFMDVYARALTNSNVSLETLGETMKYAAPIANAYGASLEDAVAMSMIMGNAGIKGSMAGTALRMGLLRLSGPPTKASKEMDELGISMSDATKMAYETQAAMEAYGVKVDESLPPQEKMFEVLKQLSTGMQDCSREEKLAAVSAIFGANAASGWVNILEQGPAAFAQIRDELRNSDGYAKQFADTMKDDTQGALTALDSALDAVSNSIGSALLPAVREGAEGITPLVTNLAEFVNTHPQVVTAAAGIAAAFAAITVGAAGVATAGAGITYISAGLELAGMRATAAAARVRAFWAANNAASLMSGGGVMANLGQAYSTVANQVTAAAARVRAFWIANNAGSMASGAANAIRSLGSAFASVGRSAMTFALSPVGAAMIAIAAAGMYCYQNWDRVAPVFQGIAETLGGSLSTTISEVSTSLQNMFTNLETSGTLSAINQVVSAIGGGLVGAIAVAANVIAAFVGGVGQMFSGVVQIVSGVVSNISGFFSNVLAGNFSAALDNLKNLAVNAFEGLAKIITAPFEAVGNAISGIGESFGRLFGDAPKVPEVSATAATAPETAQAPQLDTSQAQEGLDAAGQAGNNFAETVSQNAQSTQGLSENISSIGEGAASFSESISTAGNEITNLQTNFQGASTEITNLQTNSQGASTELTNLQNVSQVAGQNVSQMGTEAQAAQSGIMSLGQAAQSAVAGVSGLGNAAGSVAQALQGKAAEISSIKISVPQVSTVPVAANAQGGIYKRGAFLTTFAEESPEAAIPLDGSNRAVELWTQAGQILGQLPGNETSTENTSPPNPESVMDRLNRLKEASKYLPPTESNLRNTFPTPSTQKINSFDDYYNEAIKYLPQTPTNTRNIPQTNKSSTDSLNRLREAMKYLPQTESNTRNILQTPMMTTFPAQNNSSDIVPQGKLRLEGNLGRGETSSASSSGSMPPINISITINGNADRDVMQQAGNELAVNLERQIESWFKRQTHERMRRSYE